MNMRVFTPNEAKDFSQVYPLDSPGKLKLEVDVNDNALRSKGVNYDGLEKVFALVPKKDGTWGRYDLAYAGSPRRVDTHEVTLQRSDPEIDWSSLPQSGVAFGLDCRDPHTGDTTVWLQQPDHNYRVLPRT